MRRVMKTWWLCVLPVVLAGPPVANAQWGTLRGRVVLSGAVPEVPLLAARGDVTIKEPICRAHDIVDESLVVDVETQGVANVFVFLQRSPANVHPELASAELAPVVFDQKACRFFPHAVVVRTRQTVLVKSDDPVLHNTHTFPTFNTPQNLGIPPNERAGVPFVFQQREPGPVQVKCDIHPWMTAWWLVVDHPYAAVTNERGEFVIEKLPAGPHKFRVWQERAEWVDKSLAVEIRDGETTELAPIDITAAAVMPR